MRRIRCRQSTPLDRLFTMNFNEMIEKCIELQLPAKMFYIEKSNMTIHSRFSLINETKRRVLCFCLTAKKEIEIQFYGKERIIFKSRMSVQAKLKLHTHKTINYPFAFQMFIEMVIRFLLFLNFRELFLFKMIRFYFLAKERFLKKNIY